jgi:hypothetical protein
MTIEKIKDIREMAEQNEIAKSLREMEREKYDR